MDHLICHPEADPKGLLRGGRRISDWRILRCAQNDNRLFQLLIIAGFSLAMAGCGTTPKPVALLTPGAAEGPIPIRQVTRQDLVHEVGPLETLWRIAKMYNVDQQAIVDANRLKNPASIPVGRKLLIPLAAERRSVIPLYRTRPWSYIVIHHSATDEGNALLIDRAHHARGFWDGLGYHFLIDNGTRGKGNGQIEVSPRWIKQKNGAHCNAAGMNENGIGICLVGNFSEDRVSGGQLDSLVFLVNTLRNHYQIPLDHIIRHRDVPGKNTECPGNHFPWQELKQRLAKFQ